MLSKPPSEHHIVFVREINLLVRELQEVYVETRKTKPNKESEYQLLAENWTEKAGEFTEKLLEIVEKASAEDNSNEVQRKETDRLIRMLIGSVRTLNKITIFMYSILNDIYLKNVYARKAVLEDRTNKTKEEEKAKKELTETEKRFEQRKEERLRKQLESEKRDEIIKQGAYERALKEHLAWLEENKQTVSAETNRDRDLSPMTNSSEGVHVRWEDTILRKRNRRSRSFSRRIFSTVKKTIRRSISAVNQTVRH